MIDYHAWIKACKELKLDPNKFGDNSLEADSQVLGTCTDSFDLETINFPKKETEQVLRIGQIIYNLISQTALNNHFNLMKAKGVEEYRRTKLIRRIMPLLNESLNFWLKSGLEKCKSKKELISHNGKVYEINPDYNMTLKKMNDDMKKVHEDFQKKSSASWDSAKKIILD